MFLLLLGPYHFHPLLCPSLHNVWNVPLISLIFLKRSLVFPFLLFSSISLHWSLRKAFLSLLAILWNSAFKWVYLSFSPLPLAFLFSAIFRPPQTTILPFYISFLRGWFWSLPPVQYHELIDRVPEELWMEVHEGSYTFNIYQIFLVNYVSIKLRRKKFLLSVLSLSWNRYATQNHWGVLIGFLSFFLESQVLLTSTLSHIK